MFFLTQSKSWGAGILACVSLFAYGEDATLGIWQHRGYGDIYELTEDSGKLYQVNNYGCVLAASMSKQAMLDNYLPQARLSHHDQVLRSRADWQPFTSKFKRISALPYLCEAGSQLTADASPVEVYDFFWETMNEYYAFFQERGIDWNQVYLQALPKLNQDMSNDALFALLKDSLSGFNDFHVSLTSAEQSYAPAPAKGVMRRLEDGFAAQTEYRDYTRYASDILARLSLIQQSMMDEGSVQVIQGLADYSVYGKERIVWGTFKQGAIGYLRFNLMALGYGDNPASPAQWLANAKAAMDQAMADLANTQSLIIDMRINGGGIDGVAMEIASRFNPAAQETIGKYTRTLYGEGKTHWAELAASSTPAYTRPVVVMDSGSTVSAGEVFLMAMKALPQVSIVGEPTSGSLSDILFKTLPNGWELALSNEVYVDTQYQGYEVTGVQPDTSLVPFQLDEVAQGKDTALSWVITQLQ